ncbi:MAG: hypothetical protein HY904_07400 [Deltaproteobacteria bacterium]|nr:hypothetical protein [Deltaproteobacteria bacterium]
MTTRVLAFNLCLWTVLSACDRPGDFSGLPQGSPQGPAVVHVSDADQDGPITTESAAASVDINYPAQGPGDSLVVEVLTPRGKVYLTDRYPLPPSGTVSIRIPVLGTVIQNYRMTGTWTVRAYYNHEQAPSVFQQFDVLPAPEPR